MDVSKMTMRELSSVVWCTLDQTELWLQVSEEAAELCKAAASVGQYAAKMKRARDGKNPTPVTEIQCLEEIVSEMRNVYEEYKDLRTAYKIAMGLWETHEEQRPKMERWVKRLLEADKED